MGNKKRGKIKNGRNLYHTAQPSLLAAFQPWGIETGAGRISSAAAKIVSFFPCLQVFL